MPKSDAGRLACIDPFSMLEVLRLRASDRKVRLFAFGRCRLTLTDSKPVLLLWPHDINKMTANRFGHCTDGLTAHLPRFDGLGRVHQHDHVDQ
jgi:hypothetical protein